MSRKKELLDKRIESFLKNAETESLELSSEFTGTMNILEKIQSAAPPKVRDGFKFELKEKLANKANKMVRGDKATLQAGNNIFTLLASIRLKVASIIVALSVFAGSTAYAASVSMPGDILYPVKLASEKIIETMTIGKEAKTELNLNHYQKRLDELEVVVEEDNLSELDGLISSLNKREEAVEKDLSFGRLSGDELKERFREKKEKKEKILNKLPLDSSSKDSKREHEEKDEDANPSKGGGRDLQRSPQTFENETKKSEELPETTQVKGSLRLSRRKAFYFLGHSVPQEPPEQDALLESVL